MFKVYLTRLQHQACVLTLVLLRTVSVNARLCGQLSTSFRVQGLPRQMLCRRFQRGPRPASPELWCGPCLAAPARPLVGSFLLTNRSECQGSNSHHGSQSLPQPVSAGLRFPASNPPQAVWKDNVTWWGKKRHICMCVYKCMFLEVSAARFRLYGSPLTLPCKFPKTPPVS